MSLRQLRYFCSYPLWNIATAFLKHTRSYSDGLEIAQLLLRAAYDYRHEIPREENERYFSLLFSFYLAMLDRLDRWDEFLRCYDALMRVTSFYLTYAADAEALHGPKLRQYILDTERGFLKVHFLWGQHHRREIIERKMTRQRDGRSVGHLRHAQKNELTPHEISRRIAWLIKWFRYRQASSEYWKAHWRARTP
jgi:hypothetical protein